MTILDTFFILFEANTEKLDKGLGDAEKKSEGLLDKLKKIDPAATKAGEGLFKVVGQAAGLLGIGLSIGALVAGIKSTAAAYDELGKLASRFRSTADAVDEFRDAASLLGIDEEKSTGALIGLETAVQDTFLGLGRAKVVFEELGIAVTDANGKIKPTTEVMGELAGKLSGLERGTQIRVMERLGLDPSLLKLFNADMVELQRRMGDVDRASGFNLEAAVKRSQEYTKANKALSLEVNVLRMYMGKLLEAFQVAALPYFTEALTTAAKYVRMFVDYLMQHQKFVEGVFIAIGSAILYFLVPAALKGAAATLAMIAPFLLIGAAVAAVGLAFALAYEDIAAFMAGGDSLIGQVLQKWPVIGEVARDIWQALQELWAGAVQVFEFFVDMWNDPQAAFGRFLDFVLGGIKSILQAIPGVKQAMSLFGMGEGPEGAAAGRQQLGAASGAGLASQTSNSISNSRTNARSTSVQIGEVKVQTQATDAAGISKAIGGTMTSQMRQAVAGFDDGVLA